MPAALPHGRNVRSIKSSVLDAAANRHERVRDYLSPAEITRLLDAAKAGGHGAVNYLVATAAERAGLHGMHPHMLRHPCGFALADQGHDLRLIQNDLGHRDPRHTVHSTRTAGRRFERVWQ